ncbi:MAG: metallopeptidase TldD-related protein [Azospirillaceae bacterium]
MPDSQNDPLALLDDLLTRARRAGADAADAVLVEGRSISLAQRLGKPEAVTRSEGGDLGLRVFFGRQVAAVSSSDLRLDSLDGLVERAVAMARAVPEDPFVGLADAELLARDWPDLDMVDPDEPSADRLIELARVAEEAALAVAGVTNSDGAEASWGSHSIYLATSNGFAGGYARTGASLAVRPIAGEGTGMEGDYDFTAAVYFGDLRDPSEIGRSAGEKAVARLNARPARTGAYPVVFDPRVARSVLGHLTGAINGAAIARGTSFLKEAMGEAVMPAGVHVVDEPLLPRGLRSKPFDAEGLPTSATRFVDDGVLTSWILDLRSARQLGLAPTGHAARGVGSPPHPSTTNLSLSPGDMSPEAMIGTIDQGLYVTSLMGQGVNLVTGDYSRGASGFWIEKGEFAHPVNECTIAGHLKAMFRALTPANDLVRRYGTDAPTLRIDGMTVAGR